MILWNAFGLSHALVVFGPSLGSATTFGRLEKNPLISGRRALHRKIVAVEDRERRAGHQRHDPVRLPVAKNLLIPAVRLSPERQTPLVAQHEAVAGVEQRPAALRADIERVLRQIILSGQRL